MRVALINPAWSFEGSIYFGCREPHLPLELGYSKALLEAAGHEVLLVDGQLDDLAPSEPALRVAAFGPEMTVVTTAPSYLFWRCAPPELRVPALTIRSLREQRVPGSLVVVGPHGSTTPKATLRKLEADAVVLGECEEVLVQLATGGDWATVPSVCTWRDGEPMLHGAPHASNMAALPALRWPHEAIRRHAHHHHRFDTTPVGPGAELEVSRGCPYRCTFCAKENFRNAYRKRPLATVLDELDGLLAAGITYFYCIDEIFLPDRALLAALAARRAESGVRFGVQTRIDLWDDELLALLGAAGCVSIEAGVESISIAGRAAMQKRCKLDTIQLAERLIAARRHVPFVQANLLEGGFDDPAAIDAWRDGLLAQGVWANKPVPLFPYPGSPDYTKRWGLPDDIAWERAHGAYLETYTEFSDIQEERPLPLPALEAPAAGERP